jgi:myo-inositol-1(or 4)-monophosphatase
MREGWGEGEKRLSSGSYFLRVTSLLKIVAMQLDKLIQLVKIAAVEELLPRFQHRDYAEKSDGSLVTAADLAMQKRLAQSLHELFPDIVLLGEESDSATQQAMLDQHEAGVWILDPLDGTTNFAAGLPFFAVSLGLLVAGEMQLGIVYDPVRDECFSAAKGQGAYLNGARLQSRTPRTPLRKGLGLVDFKRLPNALANRLLQQAPYASQRSLGSVVLDWCWIAAGRAHVYLHGKQKLWDFAAASLILTEAGGYACTLDGETVFCASLNPRSAVAALDHAVFTEWREYLQIPQA